MYERLSINRIINSKSDQFIDNDEFNNNEFNDHNDHNVNNDPIEEASWFMFEGYKQYEHFYGRGMVR